MVVTAMANFRTDRVSDRVDEDSEQQILLDMCTIFNTTRLLYCN